jgi:hypothetical protein
MKRTGITTHTVAGLRALTTIIPQLGDQVMITDLGHSVFKYVPVVATDDSLNIIVQDTGTIDYTWVRQGINLIGAFSVPYTALADNMETTYEVNATGLVRDGAYISAVVSGEPANAAGVVADYERVRPSAAAKLAVRVSNNTGDVLVAGTLILNVFQIGG